LTLVARKALQWALKQVMVEEFKKSRPELVDGDK